MHASVFPLWPLAAVLSLQAQEAPSIEQAIHRAWQGQPGLQAGAALVEKSQAEAQAYKDLVLPTLSLQAGLQRTDEPMMAFGWKLNQARITPADFNPAVLNHPDPITGFGASLSLNQPLYVGGRLRAARRAGEAMAQAEGASQAHRKQQVAQAVVQAYFGAQVAEQGLRWAEDTLRQAQETERFVTARVEQGLMLKSEADRARAFRAQSEAGIAEAKQRLASARSALFLLSGIPQDAKLSTAVDAAPPEVSAENRRSDLEALRNQVEAARVGTKAAKGSLLPEVGLNASLGTARYTWSEGGNWSSVGVGAKWTFSFSELRKVSAARAQARAAELGLKWQEAQASREVEEARRAVDTATAKLAFAKEAVAASDSVRSVRAARHREGLLPLVEVLDAESALSGARTLLLNSQLDLRLSRAALALAQGQPIEGVKE